MSDNEKQELKAGHAPAVKAGGMRIVQNKSEKSQASGDAATSTTPEEEEEYPTPSPPTKAEKHNQSVLLSGVVTKGDKDFPPEAIKVMHEKPVPKHENRSPQVHTNRPINQPRK